MVGNDILSTVPIKSSVLPVVIDKHYLLSHSVKSIKLRSSKKIKKELKRNVHVNINWTLITALILRELTYSSTKNCCFEFELQDTSYLFSLQLDYQSPIVL
jgi:hypothetical protein